MWVQWFHLTAVFGKKLQVSVGPLVKLLKIMIVIMSHQRTAALCSKKQPGYRIWKKLSNTKNEQIAYASRQQAQRFNTMPSNFTCFIRDLYNCGGDSEFPVLWTELNRSQTQAYFLYARTFGWSVHPTNIH